MQIEILCISEMPASRVLGGDVTVTLSPETLEVLQIPLKRYLEDADDAGANSVRIAHLLRDQMRIQRLVGVPIDPLHLHRAR